MILILKHRWLIKFRQHPRVTSTAYKRTKYMYYSNRAMGIILLRTLFPCIQVQWTLHQYWRSTGSRVGVVKSKPGKKMSGRLERCFIGRKNPTHTNPLLPQPTLPLSWEWVFTHVPPSPPSHPGPETDHSKLLLSHSPYTASLLLSGGTYKSLCSIQCLLL